ncbi:MAG: hypothetical protein KDI19_08275, partial [Pseudomonadales bacterium]|nr:hypothetical protein [Pseudomonadales bacterium]
MSRYVAQPDGPVVVLGLDVISHALHESYGDSAYDAGAWLATLLRELSSIVTLALYTTDSAADSRRSLLAGGLYDLFGDLRLVGGMDDLARMKQMLDLQPDESRLFVVGPGAAPLFAGAEGYVYVPGLTLLYGALAGQEIVLADVRYDGRMGREARQRLARSSVLPVYHADHHEPDERFVMYLCEGSRTQLEMAGFSVTQLADTSVAG